MMCNDFIISRHLLSLGLRVIGIDPINNLSIPYDLKNNPWCADERHYYSSGP